jgi:hypothetical protein
MTKAGGAVHAFRLLRNSTTKATDHELQKYDIFTRYGQGARAFVVVPSLAALPLGLAPALAACR